MLYKFLVKNFSTDYQISEDYCVAIDTFNAQVVIYNDLLNGTIPFLINKTIDEIKER